VYSIRIVAKCCRDAKHIPLQTGVTEKDDNLFYFLFVDKFSNRAWSTQIAEMGQNTGCHWVKSR